MIKLHKEETVPWILRSVFHRPAIVFLALMVMILWWTPQLAKAQFGGESHVKAELLSEVTSLQPGSDAWLAIRMVMDENWHTYWRNPGDSGLETTVEWTLPDGITAGAIQWPYPKRIEEPPLTTFGYKGEIYLLIRLRVSESVKTGQQVALKGTLSWLECAEVCIPGETTIQTVLPVREEPAQTNEELAEVFAQARSQMPLQQSGWQFDAAYQGNTLKIMARAPEWFNGKIRDLTFFPYQKNVIKNTAAQELSRKDGILTLTVPLNETAAEKPDTLKGVLVSDSGWRGQDSEKAVEFTALTGDELQAVGSTSHTLSSVWLAILFAFLGGIILNLMPCVLPVLSIKIMGFVNQAHDENAKPWQHGIVFTLGVLLSFWVLAIALLVFQAGGEQLGWGFQLQSPIFLIILSAFLFLFGLSMFGVFEIGTSLTTIEGKTQGSSGFMGSFVSGITATVVATPCTAPFMGGALGYALTQPAWVSLLVFTFLALGMAAPYVLFSSVPALLKFVPKPGRWMESLKQFMGFLLVGTVVWLLWVLGLQSGPNVIVLTLIALLVTALGAWIYGRWGHLAMPAKTRAVATVLAVIMVVVGNGFAISAVDDFAVSATTASASSNSKIDWQPFEKEKVEELVAQGKPVFIDFTAAWCLSCQVNEQVAFGSQKVQDKFSDLGIVAMKADWTSRDESITRALASYGRNSVPLYVLYTGDNNQPKILPEIITPGIILDHLKSIKSN
ncbi:MAG: DUF255 domain-containing protein [Caldithrix sp.]|nr:DUF255 domain-containing protein [Caldithrix sp.]